MYYLYRLTFFFLCFFGSAHALVPVQTTATWQFGSGSGSASTPQEACAAGTAFVQAGQPSCKFYDAPCTWSPSYVGDVCDAVRNGNTTYRITIGAVTACPANSIPAGGSNCACSTGFTEINGACEAKNEDRDRCSNWGLIAVISGGSLVQDYRLQGNVADAAQYCMQGAFDSPAKGCKVSFSRDAFLDYGGSNSVTEGTFSIAANASSVDQSCSVGDENTPPKVPPVEKCKGGYTGTVNGVEVCINKVPDSGVGNNDKEETTDTEQETKKVKTESKTECKNGTCTTTNTVTTTTTQKPGGSSTTSTSTTTTTQGQGTFCKENPGTKMCSTGEEGGIGDVGGVTGGKQHGQPELYESSYPNGIKGVWEASGIAGADGKFGQLVGALLPGIADTNGACLSFQVPMNIGIVDFGILDISPPCIIWPFIRICILITALWLARSLIFGG